MVLGSFDEDAATLHFSRRSGSKSLGLDVVFQQPDGECRNGTINRLFSAKINDKIGTKMDADEHGFQEAPVRNRYNSLMFRMNPRGSAVLYLFSG
jgi:hypothetical protein